MEERLQALEAKVDRLTRLVESVVERFGEFVEEMTPVSKTVMETGIRELARVEKKGYFDFARDLMEALDRVVEGYEPGSLPELADSFADVVLVLRQLSQPRILAALQDVAEEFTKSPAHPVELLGTTKRIETEKDLQRGLGLAMDLFGTLGRSVGRAPRLRTSRSAPQAARPARALRNPESPPPAQLPAEDFAFVPDEQWSQQWAEEMAQKLGVGPLNEERWKIIEFSRKDYQETQKAPNIRRITKSLDISTKEVYALFPSAPGPTISKIAGVPKPAGCL